MRWGRETPGAASRGAASASPLIPSTISPARRRVPISYLSGAASEWSRTRPRAVAAAGSAGGRSRLAVRAASISMMSDSFHPKRIWARGSAAGSTHRRPRPVPLDPAGSYRGLVLTGVAISGGSSTDLEDRLVGIVWERCDWRNRLAAAISSCRCLDLIEHRGCSMLSHIVPP